MDIAQYLLANIYSSLPPFFNMAATARSLNSEQQSTGPEFFGSELLFWGIAIISIISLWKIFTKAGQSGWLSIIPIANMVILLKIVRKPAWWILLYFVPFVNIVIGFVVIYELGRVFGKSLGFNLGLMFLPFIFFPILAFGSATYNQPTQTQNF